MITDTKFSPGSSVNRIILFGWKKGERVVKGAPIFSILSAIIAKSINEIDFMCRIIGSRFSMILFYFFCADLPIYYWSLMGICTGGQRLFGPGTEKELELTR